MKHVRVENADMAPFRVLVQVWEKSRKADGFPDELVREFDLANPCDMAGGDGQLWVNPTRYLVVKEAHAG